MFGDQESLARSLTLLIFAVTWALHGQRVMLKQPLSYVGFSDQLINVRSPSKLHFWSSYFALYLLLFYNHSHMILSVLKTMSCSACVTLSFELMSVYHIPRGFLLIYKRIIRRSTWWHGMATTFPTSIISVTSWRSTLLPLTTQ